MVTITNLIIHEIIKQRTDKEEPELKLSNGVITPDETTLKFIENIHISFSNNTIKNTRFADRNDKAFKKQTEKYLNNNTDFFAFTKTAIFELKSSIAKEPLAVGGYYLFCDYTIDSIRYLSTIILRKKEGFNFTLKDGKFQISSSDMLNIERLAMGVRLNYAIYSSETDERNYLALVTNQNDKLSDYFIDWIVADAFISNDENSKTLVKILKHITLPTDENGNEESRDTFTSRAYLYISDDKNKLIDIRVLSEYLFGTGFRNTLSDYAIANQLELDTEFKKIAKEFKHLIKIKAKVRGIELIADYNKINDNEIQVTSNKVIIHSKELAEEITRQRNE